MATRGPGDFVPRGSDSIKAAMAAEKRAYENSGPSDFKLSKHPSAESGYGRGSSGPNFYGGRVGRGRGGRGFGGGYDSVDRELNRYQPAFDQVQRYPSGYGGQGGGNRGGNFVIPRDNITYFPQQPSW